MDLEIRAIIKFMTKEGMGSNRIRQRLLKVYGDSTPSLTTVKKWHKRFQNGRESLEDYYEHTFREDGLIICPPHSEMERAESSHAHLYKCSKQPASMQEKREKMLELIKEKRNNDVNNKRGIEDFLSDSDEGDLIQDVGNNQDDELFAVGDGGDESGNERELEEEMETNAAGVDRTKKKSNCKLMKSVWLTEVPMDLAENWVFKLCPRGRRNLVISYKQRTKAFSRRGKLRSVFQSMLPGGNTSCYGNTFAVLDCIFRDNQYYVLDILAWNGCSVKLCNTEFRFFFLNSKIDEIMHEVQTQNKFNAFPFHTLQDYPAQSSVIESVMSEPYVIDGVEVPVDGLLFYHKEMIYLRKLSPLVCWLKPYMVPEVFGLDIHEAHTKGKSKSYTTFENHLRILEERQQQIMQKRQALEEAMMDCQSQEGAVPEETSDEIQEPEGPIEEGFMIVSHEDGKESTEAATSEGQRQEEARTEDQGKAEMDVGH